MEILSDIIISFNFFSFSSPPTVFHFFFISLINKKYHIYIYFTKKDSHKEFEVFIKFSTSKSGKIMIILLGIIITKKVMQ